MLTFGKGEPRVAGSGSREERDSADPVAAISQPVDVSRWPIAPQRRPQMPVIAAAVVVSALWYFPWRVGAVGDTGPAGMGLLVLEFLALAGTVLTLLVMARGWRPPLRRQGRVTGSVDVFITVCGEPVELVEQTMRAALALAHEVRVVVLNDGAIAGSADWSAIDELAARLGIECVTRTEGPRGKAANLNNGLRHSTADFVLTVDADHRLRPDAIERALGFLVDPDVAFVASYQHFDFEGGDPLNNREAFFYEVIQPARDRDSVAFSCGNGTLWRRAALDSIGGFSEWNLVEDLHTSYRLHARGWQSAYCATPLSIGTAPTTAAEFLAQRRRWAIDSLRLLFFDSPLRAPTLRPWDRIHYIQTGTSYLFSSLNVLFLLGPAAYLFFRIPLLDPGTDAQYLLHTVPYLASIGLLMVATIGLRRTVDSFQALFFTAPTFVAAVPRALFGWHRPGGTTRKVKLRRVSPSLLVPGALLAVCVASGVWAFVDDRAGFSSVALGWATLFALALVGPILALGGWIGRSITRNTARALLAAPLTAVLLVPSLEPVPAPAQIPPEWVTAADVDSGETHLGPAVIVSDPVDAEDRTTLVPPEGGIYFGVSHPGILSGPEALQAWENTMGSEVQIAHWFQQWQNGETRFRGDWIDAVHAQGAIPMISWEPWSKPPGEFEDIDQAEASLSVILSGEHDELISTWAEAAAGDGRPLLLRFMHEMNGSWYPWSVEFNDNSPEKFIAAWRYVHDIFTDAGATNVSWVWSVNELRGMSELGTNIASYYPGDEYVDWVSYSGFNWGDAQFWSDWTDPVVVLGPVNHAVSQFDKPIMIAETGTVPTGGDVAAWMSQFASDLDGALHDVDAVVWFDMPYQDAVDFRVPPLARPALAEVADHQVPLVVE